MHILLLIHQQYMIYLCYLSISDWRHYLGGKKCICLHQFRKSHGLRSASLVSGWFLKFRYSPGCIHHQYTSDVIWVVISGCNRYSPGCIHHRYRRNGGAHIFATNCDRSVQLLERAFHHCRM